MRGIHQLKKFKDTFVAKNFLLVICGLLVVAAGIFLFLYNNYQEDFVVDLDGYMIGIKNLENIKSDEIEIEEFDVVKVKSNESIYKNTFNNYIEGSKNERVNVNYPLYVNDGLAIVNYNENVNLLDINFNRSVGYKNLVLSYGKI